LAGVAYRSAAAMIATRILGAIWQQTNYRGSRPRSRS